MQDLLKLVALAADGVPLLGSLLGLLVSPVRWLLWFGLLLLVYQFPTAVVGRLRALALRRRG